jgi:hypothetical protein
MTKDGANDAAAEVVETHLGYTGAKNAEFRKKNFDRAW